MTITPTDKGSLIAGVGISSLAWASIFKLDYLAKLMRINRWISQDRLFNWINGHKSITMLATEVVNFGVHGIGRPDSVLFALGSTIINGVCIFVVVPLRMMMKREKGLVL